MASITTILLFFLYLWGFGYSATLFVKNADNWFERNIMRIGLGFSGFALAAALLNFFGVPIDWRAFLILTLVGPIYGLMKAYRKGTLRAAMPKMPELKLTKTTLCALIVLLFFFASLFMYIKGSFVYPYLEDQDPWGYALAVKYIATEKTLEDPPWMDPNAIGYIDPYPPLYTTLMAVLHQTSSEMNWTLKFFNALIVSLGILFFYFFVLHFMGNRNKALFATAVLTLLPSYLSHFIWSHALIPGLFFTGMYTFLKAQDDKRWYGVAALAFAGILLTHHRQPFNIIIFVLLFIFVRSIAARRIAWQHLASGVGALVLSFIWWLPGNRWIEALRVTGVAERTPEWATALESSGGLTILISFFTEMIPKYFRPTGGTGTRTYFFEDFFFAQMQNMINNPIGIGVVIYLLLFVGILALVLVFRRQLKEKALGMLKYGTGAVYWVILPFAGILALRYFSLLIGGMKLFPAIFSLWLDLIFYLSAAMLGVFFLITQSKRRGNGGLDGAQEDGQNISVWAVTSLLWLVAFFVLVTPTSFNFPIGIEPWRTWMHLSVPVAILAAEGAFFLNTFARHYRFGSMVLFFLLIGGMVFTSGIQKYSVNTALWPSGFMSTEELEGYGWLLNLPANTKVFPYSGRGVNAIGFNMFTCDWCLEDIEFRKRQLDRSPEELKDFLKAQHYEYLMLDAMSFRTLPRYTDHTANETAERLPGKIEEILQSGLFQPVHQTPGVIIFRVS